MNKLVNIFEISDEESVGDGTHFVPCSFEVIVNDTLYAQSSWTDVYLF